ncbi:hypothetical protein D9757_011898 [Collybiopsis confluens]|uniref:Uncharacterized protein n=1 Tax=Collybiopsis confluens TaxID=2823264 RepID=A0A8H5LP81_9AGAR|nr:hypothetical protein D9757_011898 [Collybiopsis confluens]
MASNNTIPINTGSNPFAPQEPPELLFLEYCDFIGTNISQMFYGVTVVLFFHCIKNLVWPRSPQMPSLRYYLAGYTFCLFSLATIFVAMNLHDSVLSFIYNRNYPGGPETYFEMIYSKPTIIIPNVAFVLSNLFADGLLMFRCKIIWAGKSWILALPATLYLASAAMGIMFLYQSSSPNSNLFSSGAVDFGLPYFAIATTLNILLTLLISVQLILHQRHFKDNNLVHGRGLSYSAIVTMLVESSALYSIFSLLFLGTYASGSSASALFLPILAQTQIIAPLLIISRVASQRAYTSRNSGSKALSPLDKSIRFSPRTTDLESLPLEESPTFSAYRDHTKETLVPSSPATI